MPKGRRLVAWIAAGAAFALIAQFGFFFYRDNFATSYPLKVISAASYRAAEIPYWNFHDSGGQPLAGNPGPQTFYPDNILYLLLPAHVAFNLHFLLHLTFAWFAMRALCRAALDCGGTAAAFAATVYVLSGVVVSSTASYHAVVVVALIPFALYAVERRSWRLLGIACGLMGLAAEPVLIAAAGMAIAIVALPLIRPFAALRATFSPHAGRRALDADVPQVPLAPPQRGEGGPERSEGPGEGLRIRDLAAAVVLALVIASPQLIALSEITGEVERIAGFSTRTALNTSLTWTRVAEIFTWPLLGVLNEPGGGPLRERLFSTIFLGLIALPALMRKSRYTVIALLMLFLALGRNNPIVFWLVDHGPRLIRFPEKFVLVFTIAAVVLIAHYFDKTRYRAVWAIVTLVPLVITVWRALPVDWFGPYDVRRAESPPLHRYVRSSIPIGVMPAREEYRKRAAGLEPLFGAVAGVRYAYVPSPDSMHSLLSRAALERFHAAPPPLKARYLRISELPPVMVVPFVLPAASLRQAVAIVEDPRFDERTFAVAPARFGGFRSARMRHLRYEEHGQTIFITLDAEGAVVLLVNQSYFAAWVARAGNAELATFPVDIDRLGIFVPKGTTSIALHFGRRRLAVAVAWCASLLLLLAVLAIEIRDRRAREVERAGDDDRALV
jgi:hypothetical protein